MISAEKIQDNSRPNFFLIGAPKCGTSAIAHYLSEHPQVCFSYPKEPYYWATDFPGIRSHFGVQTLTEYMQLFVNMSESKPAGGEGSTLYLGSANAVKSIMQFQPAAKFIVMLRNPSDMVVSAHLQELSHLNENESSFIKAWNLQEARKEGRHIPAECYEPKLLQYGEIARLGFQIDRLYKTVPRERVHVIFFDDIHTAMPKAYSDVLQFLNLKHDGRTEFPRVNDAKMSRYRWLTRILNGRTGTAVSRFLKRRLTGRLVTLGDKAKKLMTNQKAIRPDLPPEFTEELCRVFRDDIQLLSDLTKRDLSKWLGPRLRSATENSAAG